MEALLQWLREFFVIYLILSVLTQLAAADKYKKYLRFFSGIILLLFLLKPFFVLAGQPEGPDVKASYEAFWNKLDGIHKEDAGSFFAEYK